MQVQTVQTPELGDRSYLIHDGHTGLVIDPQRDLDRVEAEITQAGVTIAWVLETHLHNDYVSGGAELVRRTGAHYGMAAGDDISVEHQPLADGDSLLAGELRVTVVATPGHTEHHLAYIVETADEDPVAFTGGNLLYGTVGRTDLITPELTEELTRAQYRSARRLVDRLPDDTRIFPTHGFGSFCSSTAASQKASSTVAEERSANHALTTSDEQAFVDQLVAGLTEYPRYYAHMGAINRHGAPAPDLTPPEPVGPATLRTLLQDGTWVIDIRDRVPFAAHHLHKSVNIELGQQFSSYLGWIVPWDATMTLIADTPDQIAAAQRDLSRISVERDRITGAATGSIDDLADGDTPQAYRRADWGTLADALTNSAVRPVVIDVRRADEFRKSHLDDAINIPIQDLPHRLADAPDEQLWIHCGSGYRAAIAASILHGAGHDVVHVDDNWPPPDSSGLAIVEP